VDRLLPGRLAVVQFRKSLRGRVPLDFRLAVKAPAYRGCLAVSVTRRCTAVIVLPCVLSRRLTRPPHLACPTKAVRNPSRLNVSEA